MEEYFRREGKEEGLKQGKLEGLKEGKEQGKCEAKREDLIATIQLLKPYFKDVNDLYKKILSNDNYKNYSFNAIEDIYNQA